jgi:hypothetical protein
MGLPSPPMIGSTMPPTGTLRLTWPLSYTDWTHGL